MHVYEEFKVSDVSPMTTGGHNHLDSYGYGFAITNLHGSPLLSIMYRSQDEAIAARKGIDAALAEAIAVFA